jgi:hypothetical protein
MRERMGRCVGRVLGASGPQFGCRQPQRPGRPRDVEFGALEQLRRDQAGAGVAAGVLVTVRRAKRR